MNSNLKIAILIPCYNEELTIGKVIDDFRGVLPKADIYVFDNNSTDDTVAVSNKHDAIVKKEFRQGKGSVVRAMFKQVDADIYVMVDGDDTYPVDCIDQLLQPVIEGYADMVVGDRHSAGFYQAENKRNLHGFGNNLVKTLINFLFRSDLKDIMSGLRVFNKEFVKLISINSDGFEVETEMTLHALDKKYRIIEVPISYKDRPEGSYSKLNTISDGIRVIKTIFWVFKDYKPLYFFGVMSLFFFFLSMVIGTPVVVEFVQTGYINKVPSAILSTGLMLISVLSLFSAFILDTMVKQHRESYDILSKK
ncbi:MAG TPA: glycosyltransferase [Candidatus Thioglobus sp.]|jgi:glycosyltransferase involved in cell wall biosynthesis|nr:glycosyltransferase [Candidatus Thioglobus sp.]